MHSINNLFTQHGLTSHSNDKNAPISKNPPPSSDSKEDTKIIQEMLGQHKINLHNYNPYLVERRTSRGSVSSTYSYGSSISYGSSHGSSSPNYGAVGNHYSLYYTLPGSGQNHNYHSGHRYYQPRHQINNSEAVPPSSTSPTIEQEKQHHHHHHHHSIQEMIKHFGKRLGHIRRQSECQESPKKGEEDFRNRSQSLDGGAKHPEFDIDCETTYRIYESILQQGNF